MSETAMQAALDAVARGIKLLDEHGPKDWRSKIDLDELDMNSAGECVLGLLYREAHGRARIDLDKPCSEDCVCVTAWPFAYGLAMLRRATGNDDSSMPEFFEFPIMNGFIDFYHVSDDDDIDDVYVSYEDLDNAWRQALSTDPTCGKSWVAEISPCPRCGLDGLAHARIPYSSDSED